MTTDSADIAYRTFEAPLHPEVMGWMVSVNEVLFPFGESVESLTKLFLERSKPLVCIAFKEGEPVGFKAGFQDDSGAFESWRGGVLNSARRHGIAAHLMHIQHEWCQRNGFTLVKTVTNSDNSPMLILNLKSGFNIVGCFMNRNKRLKILQEKEFLT